MAHPEPDASRLSVEQARELARVAGKVLGGLKRTEARVCERCGKPFVGTSRARYCSVNCRTRAWQLRQPDYAARRRAQRQARHGQRSPADTPHP
jgi:hypothetical protein